MRRTAFSDQLSASSSGLPRLRSGELWRGDGDSGVTGRCEACGRLAYGQDGLCPVCRAELAYTRQVEALGLGRRYAETAESRALHRWMRRRERKAILRGAAQWALGLGFSWALLYLGWKFGAMFLAWAMGW